MPQEDGRCEGNIRDTQVSCFPGAERRARFFQEMGMGSWASGGDSWGEGLGREALGVWPVRASPLRPASFLPAAETLPLPPPSGERCRIRFLREGDWQLPQTPRGVEHPVTSAPSGEGSPVGFPSLQLSSLTHTAEPMRNQLFQTSLNDWMWRKSEEFVCVCPCCLVFKLSLL